MYIYTCSSVSRLDVSIMILLNHEWKFQRIMSKVIWPQLAARSYYSDEDPFTGQTCQWSQVWINKDNNKIIEMQFKWLIIFSVCQSSKEKKKKNKYNLEHRVDILTFFNRNDTSRIYRTRKRQQRSVPWSGRWRRPRHGTLPHTTVRLRYRFRCERIGFAHVDGK